mgnify:CR=1 FL=1
MKQRIFSFLSMIFILTITCLVLTSCTGVNNKADYGEWYPNVGNAPEEEIEDGFMFGESYNQINENPFYNTSYQSSSYFSMDSFTASYANLRRYIEQGHKLNGNIIKTDELLNYFKYDLETPVDGETFKVTSEMSVAPWNERHHVITIGVATEEPKYIESKENNIVFLIDVSGSMKAENKLPLLKEAFLMLLEKLNPTDRISIVTYASGVDIKADGVYADKENKLENIISSLSASGSTNGSDGIQKAYKLAEKYFVPGGINRVILATDGDFNVGISDNNQLKEFITKKAESGVYLSVLGFGMSNYQDSRVETLAKYGNGLYAYVDSIKEAKKVLVDDFNKTMITVAKDVKNKVTFNEEIVESYRLIGYENKSISQEDFENEEFDAGELGSGHQTLVTYEVVLKENVSDSINEIYNLQINYKDPKSDESKTFNYSANGESLYNKEVSEDHKFALCLVEFSLILRNSTYRGNASYDDLLNRLSKLDSTSTDELRKEFVYLVELAEERKLVAHPAYNNEPCQDILVTIYTSFGCLKARYEYDAEINYNTVMLNLFGKVPTNKTFRVCLDSSMEVELTSFRVTKDLELYVIEKK